MSQLFQDHEIFKLILHEQSRQEHGINLIASENYVSPAVREATASILTNKYAEGYPGKRYYAGCTFIDTVEQIALKRCKQLFGAEHANVQLHAGSPANMGVYFSVLKPGDTILGMQLNAGGHLTHGHAINFSGRLYNSVSYSVNPETEQLDYDTIEQQVVRHKPALLIAGASAYSRTIDFEKFAQIAKKHNVLLLVDMAHIAGLIAVGLHQNPAPFADFVTSTTHKTLRGPRGGFVLCKSKFAEQLDKTVMPGMQGGPFMHIIAAKAVAFGEALQPQFKIYQQKVVASARIMADTFIEYGYRIVSGGTDNHQFTVDLRTKNITGRQAALILESVDITVNANCIPFDPQKPWIASGIRIGTPAITTRGMQTKAVHEIVTLVHEALMHHDSAKKLRTIQTAVHALCQQYPLYNLQHMNVNQTISNPTLFNKID